MSQVIKSFAATEETVHVVVDCATFKPIWMTWIDVGGNITTMLVLVAPTVETLPRCNTEMLNVPANAGVS